MIQQVHHPEFDRRMFSVKRIGLVANFEKKEVRALIPKLQNFCQKKGWKLDKVTGAKNLNGYDFLLTLGGDGTILKTARFATASGGSPTTPKKIPILGINVGSLGFLAAAEVKDIYSVLENISQGRYLVEERTMFAGQIYRRKRKINHFLALNDCVLRNPHSVRVINLEVKVDNHLVSEYQGDGLILSTPTGSTAYNLAAGGPLVSPELPVFILTPLCPHSLTLRPLIISQEAEIKIRILSNGQEILLSIDGQEEHHLKIGDE
ncbi:MAG TPA: NAD(+) kinase, partial [Elusimicrobia bacterium]|nr:NAD(+) kinase [Elusimicrobiota bacterium]